MSKVWSDAEINRGGSLKKATTNWEHGEVPMHPCTVDIHNFSKTFHVNGRPVFYNVLDSHIAKHVDADIKSYEQCYVLTWNDLSHFSNEGSTLPEPVREFIRTVEYNTAMMAKYKFTHAIEVKEANKFGAMYIVTFTITSSY